jgi:alpha-galactosidase
MKTTGIKKIVTMMMMALALSNFSQVHASTPDSLHFLQWAQTPPMGWNSWDCYGPTVTESEVRANADFMAKHLKKYGWRYIVVDIRWFVENDKAGGYNQKDPIYCMDSYGRYIPAVNRFPSAAGGKGFKPLADYVHSLGLKFGIHIMRGIPKKAVREHCPILGTSHNASEVWSDRQTCGWLRDNYTLERDSDGAQEYYNSIMNLYASWGVDFIKVDDLSTPYHQDEIEMLRKAIDQCGRPIVLSASPGETPVDKGPHLVTHVNMWRIVGDLWDNWPSVKHLFKVCSYWTPFIGAGHFPDADMLPLGHIGIRAEVGKNRASLLTRAEQRSLMTLMCIFRSPLMFGGDLPTTDSETMKLITNADVLHVDQHSKDNRQVSRNNDLIVWTANDEKTKDKYVAMFNVQDQEQVIESKAIGKSSILSAQREHTHEKIDVDLKGSHKLYLYVSDGGNGTYFDHSDWINPILTGKKGTLKLTELKWQSATAGWGEVHINKSIDGHSLTVNGKSYPNGLGTHATSMIVYDLPEGYDHFSATVALDDDCLSHKEGASVQFFVFNANPAGTMPAAKSSIKVNFADLGINGKCRITDLWTGKVLGIFSGSFVKEIGLHDAGLFKLEPIK